MIRRPPRSTRTDTSFPTRRSSDLFLGLPTERIEAIALHYRATRYSRNFQNWSPRSDRQLASWGLRSILRAFTEWTPKRITRKPDLVSRASLSSFNPFAATRYARSRARPGSSKNDARSEEHTSELQSLMRISYDVSSLKQKKQLK